jgi:hypothetical protein
MAIISLNSLPVDLCNSEVWCSLWGTDWILKYYLDKPRLQRVNASSRVSCQKSVVPKAWTAVLLLSMKPTQAYAQVYTNKWFGMSWDVMCRQVERFHRSYRNRIEELSRSTGKNPYTDIHNRSANQDNERLLCNWKIYYRVHKNSPWDPTQKQANPLPPCAALFTEDTL